jgi:hypothetical protein
VCNGITYGVSTLEDGRFDLEGGPFKSLSAVARTITGSEYSGPVFFGLKLTSRERKAARKIDRLSRSLSDLPRWSTCSMSALSVLRTKSTRDDSKPHRGAKWAR